jgi:hypothetical protein
LLVGCGADDPVLATELAADRVTGPLLAPPPGTRDEQPDNRYAATTLPTTTIRAVTIPPQAGAA